MDDISSVPAKPDDSLRNIFQEPDWFVSLTDSEIDLLTSIKEMVIAQAKKKGCEDVAGKLSLDMYRGIGVILLEDLKERMKKTPLFRELSKGANPLDKLPMMTSDPKSSACLTEDVCSLHFVTPKRKRKRCSTRSFMLAQLSSVQPLACRWHVAILTEILIPGP